MLFTIRAARREDDGALAELDRLTWSPQATPAPPPPAAGPFFSPDLAVDQVLVAEAERGVVGYARLMPPTPLAAGAHVLELRGFAVHPDARRQGIARALLRAAELSARERGARKLSLRVLAGNAPALALYESSGFQVEGILRHEFRLQDQWVDDVLMARLL